MKDTISKERPIGAIDIDTERCKGCGLCISACPKKLIKLVEREVNRHGYPFVTVDSESSICTGCASCGIICPDGCITVYRKKAKGDVA